MTTTYKKIINTHKIYYSFFKKKKMMNYKEIHSTEMAFALEKKFYDINKVKLSNLSPKDICIVVQEMLDYIKNGFQYSKHNEKINQNYWNYYKNIFSKKKEYFLYHNKMKSKISIHFVKKYFIG